MLQILLVKSLRTRQSNRFAAKISYRPLHGLQFAKNELPNVFRGCFEPSMEEGTPH